MTFKNQIEMFKWIWENRPHVSEVSGEPLLYPGHRQWHWQFAHILNKGSYPLWKLNPDNIMLLLPEEHDRQDTFPAFRERHLELKQRYYKEFYGKEYN